MILSVSRRTDIPACHSRWFYNRIREGFVLVRNPYNPRQVTEVSLKPENVDCIVFWTKNPCRSVIPGEPALLNGFPGWMIGDTNITSNLLLRHIIR